MADSRKARREADPGLQPERTSLAWLRTLLGYGALIALAIKHNWHRTGGRPALPTTPPDVPHYACRNTRSSCWLTRRKSS